MKDTIGSIILTIITVSIIIAICMIGMKNSEERMKQYEEQLDAREAIQEEQVNYLR